jgi:hypothetical protein
MQKISPVAFFETFFNLHRTRSACRLLQKILTPFRLKLLPPRSGGAQGGGVRLVAVSKTQPGGSRAGSAGGRAARFGENRVQEARSKFPALREAFPILNFIYRAAANK